MAQISTVCQSTCTPWATTSDACAPCDAADFNAGLLADCLQASSDILFELSGRQFPGICEDTIRPSGRSSVRDYGRPVGQGSYWPGLGYGGYWSGYNSGVPWGMGGNYSGLERGRVPEITLGVYPLDTIVEVKVDGQVLDPSLYRVDDNRYLVRLTGPDGSNPGWPVDQDMTLPTTQHGTMQVIVTYGTPPPISGVKACAELACQLALACQPSTAGSCRLPQRVTQVTRQGVTAVVLDPMKFLDKGKTGLYGVDLFLSSYNPSGLRRRAAVVNPDIGRRVRRTSA